MAPTAVVPRDEPVAAGDGTVGTKAAGVALAGAAGAGAGATGVILSPTHPQAHASHVNHTYALANTGSSSDDYQDPDTSGRAHTYVDPAPFPTHAAGPDVYALPIPRAARGMPSSNTGQGQGQEGHYSAATTFYALPTIFSHSNTDPAYATAAADASHYATAAVGVAPYATADVGVSPYAMSNPFTNSAGVYQLPGAVHDETTDADGDGVTHGFYAIPMAPS
eukprot:m.17903 g.17903  ORF g.17903 m.17903 type:complete len:222 (+) comp7245_c0_seq1:1810-2475(+)